MNFEWAKLLDEDGSLLAETRCDAFMDENYVVQFREVVRFPPVDRECVPTWVKVEQVPPSELHFCIAVRDLMNFRAPPSFATGDAFQITP